MKNIVLALLLCVFAALPAYAEEEPNWLWIANDTLCVELPEGWEWIEVPDSDLFMFRKPSLNHWQYVMISAPYSSEGLDFGEYVGARLGLSYVMLAQHGKGRTVDVVEMPLNEFPGVAAKFSVEDNGQETIRGGLFGVNFGTHYVTVLMAAPPENFDAFAAEVIPPFLDELEFDPEDAEAYADEVAARSATMAEAINEIINAGRK